MNRVVPVLTYYLQKVLFALSIFSATVIQFSKQRPLFFLGAMFEPFHSVEFACGNEEIVHKSWHHGLV
jgi:hypothetical protein